MSTIRRGLWRFDPYNGKIGLIFINDLDFWLKVDYVNS